jgi:alpha-beta hydrolase superfamily lysophospholipase
VVLPILVLGLSIVANDACAAIHQRDDGPAGTAAAVELALSTLATLPPSSSARGPLDAARDACGTIAAPATGCLPLDAERCRAALATLYDALGNDAGDALGRDMFRATRLRVGDALSRLAWAPATDAAGSCTTGATHGVRAARIEIGADGRSVAVRPLRPLRAGRRYVLILDGMPADTSARWWTDASAAAEVEHDLLAAYEATFPDRGTRFAEPEARALLRRVAAEELALPGAPGTTGVRGRLSRALDGKEVARLRASFVPDRGAATPPGGVKLRVLDPRAELIAYRERLAARACPGPTPDGLALERVAEPDFSDATIAAVYRGRYASAELDGSTSSGTATGGGPASSPRPTEHGFLLALPAAFDRATTPLVLLVHGHGGNARAMLKNNAIGLARRGMASLAIDLPAHGDRTSEPELVSPLDPARLTHGLRQAVVDALAVLDATSRCGLAVPGAGRYAPADTRYLGFSLGAVVGVLLRAVEPHLGTTVLIAPSADLADWQVIQVPRVLGVTTYGACSGGPAHGRKCSGTCEPGSVCIADPQLVSFGDLLSFPYGAIFSPAQALSVAGERTGSASTAPLLIVSAGLDMAVGPAAGARLADAYGMTLDDSSGRRGRGTRLMVWPSHGHDLLSDLRVRQEAYDFLATRGRRVVPVGSGSVTAPLSAGAPSP